MKDGDRYWMRVGSLVSISLFCIQSVVGGKFSMTTEGHCYLIYIFSGTGVCGDVIDTDRLE